jgi:hypothetical protein
MKYLFETVIVMVLGAIIAFGCAIYVKVTTMEEAFEPVPVMGGPQMGGTPNPEKATHLRAKLSEKDSATISQLQSNVDSLFAADQVFAKSILFLDSCNNLKLTKAERAERRGRFVGGLLRGLFPKLPGQ